MTDDLFAEFAIAESTNACEEQQRQALNKTTALIRKTNRIEARRAKSEATLMDILPTTIDKDTSYHIASAGDIDALSYLIYIANRQRLDHILISSWCMALPDVQWLTEQIEQRKIATVDFYLGEIFPGTYPDAYQAVHALEKSGHATLTIARNHAKVIAGSCPSKDFYFVVETSANVNTNPRIEQAAIHFSQDLHDFYVDFFCGIKDIDATRNTVPA